MNSETFEEVAVDSKVVGDVMVSNLFYEATMLGVVSLANFRIGSRREWKYSLSFSRIM